MIHVQASETVGCTPAEFLAFVMDIERYAEVDRKIAPILWHRREGDLLEFACRPRLGGLRQPKIVQQVRLTPGLRLDVTLAPRPRNRLAHVMAHFEASFVCEPVADGTRVLRTLEFRFTPAVRWLLEPPLRRRLPGEVREELLLAREHFAGSVG